MEGTTIVLHHTGGANSPRLNFAISYPNPANHHCSISATNTASNVNEPLLRRSRCRRPPFRTLCPSPPLLISTPCLFPPDIANWGLIRLIIRHLPHVRDARLITVSGLNGPSRCVKFSAKGKPRHLFSLAELIPSSTANPTTALVPFRAATAFAVNSRRDASSLTAHSGAQSFAKVRKEVPLASEEGTKGVIQYALYVSSLFTNIRLDYDRW